MRLPVAAKMALDKAAAIGGSAGSPKPVGSIPLLTKLTSMAGISFIFSNAERIEILLNYGTIYKCYFREHGVANTIYHGSLNLVFGAA